MPFDGTGFSQSQMERDLTLLCFARAGIQQPGGWTQGELHSNHSGLIKARCAIGWLQVVDPARPLGDLASLLFPALPWWWRAAPSRFGMVAWYNDAPWRTQKQMVRLFDRAILRFEKRQVYRT